MKPSTSQKRAPALLCAALLAFAAALPSIGAILVQPAEFALDQQQEQSFLESLREARELQAAEAAAAAQDAAADEQEHFSQEVAELIQREHQHQLEKTHDGQPEPSLSASVAHVLMNVARAAQQQQQAAAADEQQQAQQQQQQQQQSENPHAEMAARGSILELDTSAASAAAAAAAAPSKADLKQAGPKQWFNPKETIPVIKISSMATPSKYKKVYFRAEKKLVDGAFHSPSASEKDERKSKSFATSVQRRSSRGTSSSVPPGILQDGVIDFLKKFRDVYIQTRPVNAAAASSGLAANFLASAASSPLASILAPPAGGSRPSLASAISAATSMMGSAAQVAQAASNSAPSSSSSSSPAAAAPATGAAATGAGAAPANSAKAPLSAQSYVSFWSKTFPTWVRKMLKQMRRRSLQNSSKRYQQQQQHQKHHSAGASLGQAAQAAASVAVEQAANSGGGSRQT